MMAENLEMKVCMAEVPLTALGAIYTCDLAYESMYESVYDLLSMVSDFLFYFC
jgi:hypothetical protein